MLRENIRKSLKASCVRRSCPIIESVGGTATSPSNTISSLALGGGMDSLTSREIDRPVIISEAGAYEPHCVVNLTWLLRTRFARVLRVSRIAVNFHFAKVQYLYTGFSLSLLARFLEFVQSGVATEQIVEQLRRGNVKFSSAKEHSATHLLSSIFAIR